MRPQTSNENGNRRQMEHAWHARAALAFVIAVSSTAPIAGAEFQIQGGIEQQGTRFNYGFAIGVTNTHWQITISSNVGG
jgi:hypothetical protein